MSLDLMQSRGIKLPPKETEVIGLTDERVIDKIKGFWERYNKESSADNEFAPIDFLEILAVYPVSMCSYHMSDSLKLLVAIMYFYSKPSEEEIQRQIESNKKFGLKLPVYEGLTMDYLSLIFDRSKKTIYDAIREKEQEAKKLIEDAKLRKEAREIALRELVEEEKQKLREAEIKTT